MVITRFLIRTGRMTIKRVILVLLGVLLLNNVQSQTSNLRLFNYFEFFGGFGTSHYFGDIGGAGTRWGGFYDKIDSFRDFDLLETRISTSFGARYLLNRSFAVSGKLSPIWLSGNDAGSFNADRGYYFNSFLTELSGQAEVYWLSRYTGLNPYFFVGFGAIAWYSAVKKNDFQDYVSTGNVFLGGFGFRYSANKAWTHSVELGYRYSLTDYMEMYNGSGKWNDSYYLLQYNISYHYTRGTIYDRRGLVRQNWWNRKNNDEPFEGGKYNPINQAIDPADGELSSRERRQVARHLKKISRKRKRERNRL